MKHTLEVYSVYALVNWVTWESWAHGNGPGKTHLLVVLFDFRKTYKIKNDQSWSVSLWYMFVLLQWLIYS